MQKEDKTEINTAYQAWRKDKHDPAADKHSRSPRYSTLSDVEVEALGGPFLDENGQSVGMGLPGEYPYTRGTQPNMYRGRLWTMRQFAGFGSPEDTNKRFHYLLNHGVTGLSTAFDMPTLMGYDCDHPLAEGEVGKEGVSVSSLADMEQLFAGIPLGEVTTSMTINAPAIIVMAMYVAVAEKQGVSYEKIAGTLQNDMLKEYIAQKEWMVPIRPAVKLSMDVVEFCAQNIPRFNGVSISGYHIREAGATAAQELAFTLADGLAYVQHLCDRGMDVDSFAPRLSFFWDVHSDFFEEIAKFRAARRIWAQKLREHFGAKDSRSWLLRTHAQTAGVSLTAQQPMNNVVRVALQAMAGVLGGTQSLHTNSLDETFALPTEEAVTIALRTQQIIAEESGVAGTVDPFGGSWFVEQMTDDIEAQAQSYLNKIDAMGGMVAAVEGGFPQKEISESAYHFQRQVDTGEKIIVGVNRYESDGQSKIQLLKIDDEVTRLQQEKLARIKNERDSELLKVRLAAVAESCRQDKNVFPDVLEAVRCYATVGELSDVFRDVYGQYSDPAYL